MLDVLSNEWMQLSEIPKGLLYLINGRSFFCLWRLHKQVCSYGHSSFLVAPDSKQRRR